MGNKAKVLYYPREKERYALHLYCDKLSMHVVISKITTEKDRDRIYNFKTRWEKQIDKKCFITQK